MATACYALNWLARHLWSQLLRSALRRNGLPVRIALAELRGPLDAPRAYRATYDNDCRIRNQYETQHEPCAET